MLAPLLLPVCLTCPQEPEVGTRACPLKCLSAGVPLTCPSPPRPPLQVQKYLRGRLMAFDLETLYELHYQTITLGKVRKTGPYFLHNHYYYTSQDRLSLSNRRFLQAYLQARLALWRFAALLWTLCPLSTPQVFCQKRSPNCGACPLSHMCDYAQANGKRLQVGGCSRFFFGLVVDNLVLLRST